VGGTGPFAWFKWQALFSDWRVFAEGFAETVIISALALLLALTIGILFGVLGVAKFAPARVANRVYVEFLQNTPLVIQIFFLYHALPHVGIMLPVFAVGVLGVGCYTGAYMAEAVRAGIQAIPRGQLEAAYSQGFTFSGAMRYVILPQAKRVSFPPMTNQVVNLIKNTSVMAMVAGGDLMYHADSWASTTLHYAPTSMVTGLRYLSLCLPLATYARKLERDLEKTL
jgi:putative glutamine transport system permease protein